MNIYLCKGFKEFDPYLKLLNEKEDKNGEEDYKVTLEKLKNSGIEKMKNATKRYSRKQISWIKNKFLPRFVEESLNPHQARLYILDISGIIHLYINIIIIKIIIIIMIIIIIIIILIYLLPLFNLIFSSSISYKRC